MHAGYDSHVIKERSRMMVTERLGVQELGFDSRPSYYRVIEIVHPSGLYIERAGLYPTKESAFFSIMRELFPNFAPAFIN